MTGRTTGSRSACVRGEHEHLGRAASIGAAWSNASIDRAALKGPIRYAARAHASTRPLQTPGGAAASPRQLASHTCIMHTSAFGALVSWSQSSRVKSMLLFVRLRNSRQPSAAVGLANAAGDAATDGTAHRRAILA
eukprot:7092840-Prymnesium_polylepis.2